MSAPAGRSAWAAWIRAIGTAPRKQWGNGSMPSARRRTSLARRGGRNSAPPASAPPVAGCSASATRGAGLGRDVDLGDLELAGGAVGQADLDGVALLAAHERLADRRLVGELARLDVGLRRADDRVGRRLALLVLDVDRRADPDHVVGQLGGVDDLRRVQPLLELRDPRLEHRLLVLGVVVLGVLGDVAELARLLDALGDLATLRRLQLLELRLEPFEALGGQNHVLRHEGAAV